MSVEKTDTEGIIRRVANLLASVFIYSESPTYVDRFANALSKEAVARVIYESQRIIQMGISSGEVKMGNVEITGKSMKITDKKGEESYPAVIIRTKEGRNYIVVGYLPTDKDVEDFMSLVERDIYYARKAGALAMSIANRSLLGGGE